MFYLRTLLMILMGLRLLMPPGICACQWSSSAARLWLAVVQGDRQIPAEPQRDNEDDHDAGCPASPLAAGMGVAPPCQPLRLPTPMFDLPLLPQAAFFLNSVPTERVVALPPETSVLPLYLTVRVLLL